MEHFNTHHHHHPRSEPLRWLDIAEKLLQTRDLVGSKSFATRARESDPRLDHADRILAVADTLLAAEQSLSENHLDWYSILQLAPRTHDSELISTQYRRLARLLNPNFNKIAFAEHAFKLVNDAWSVLSNPSRKFHFDSEINTNNNSNQNENNNNNNNNNNNDNNNNGNAQFGFGHTHYNFIQEQPNQHQQQATTHYNFIEPHQQQLQQQQQQFLPAFHQQQQAVNLQLLHHDTTITLPTVSLSRGLQQQQQHQHLNWPPPPQQQQQQQPLVSTHQLLPQQFFPQHQQTLPRPQVQPQPQSPPPRQVVAHPQPRLSSPQAKRPQPSPKLQQQQPSFVQPQPQPQTQPQTQTQPQPQQPVVVARPQPQQNFVQPQPQQQQQPIVQPQPQQQQQQQPIVHPQPQQPVAQPQPQQPTVQPQPPPQPVQPQSGPQVEPPVSQTKDDGGDNGGIPEKTFWTACPYCYNMYEYNVAYAECTLRCQNCKRAFHAAVIADPPMISEGKEASFCCWVNFPFGVSMSYLERSKTDVSNWTPFSTMFAVPVGGSSEKNAGKQKNPKKNSGPRIYVDDDHEVFVELSSSGSDGEWGSTRKTKKTKSAAAQGRSQDFLFRSR